MFKHILVPTDGSELSGRAIDLALRLAKVVGAKVSGVHVIVHSSSIAQGFGDTMLPMQNLAKQAAEAFLKEFGERASKSGIAHDAFHVTGESAWEEIVRVAAERNCDLICMASHGRRGLSALLLGSETTKVLTYAKVPVLVSR
jgi:nucleotide-binding universal stress UspA family protein